MWSLYLYIVSGKFPQDSLTLYIYIYIITLCWMYGVPWLFLAICPYGPSFLADKYFVFRFMFGFSCWCDKEIWHPHTFSGLWGKEVRLADWQLTIVASDYDSKQNSGSWWAVSLQPSLFEQAWENLTLLAMYASATEKRTCDRDWYWGRCRQKAKSWWIFQLRKLVSGRFFVERWRRIKSCRFYVGEWSNIICDMEETQILTACRTENPEKKDINFGFGLVCGRWEYSSTMVDSFRFPPDFSDQMVEHVLQISRSSWGGYSLFFLFHLTIVIFYSRSLSLFTSAWRQQDKLEYT